MDDAYTSINEKKLSSLNETLPVLEAVVQSASRSSSSPRSRRRSACDPRREQAPRRPQGCSRQGSGSRRSPQGHVAGHRDPDGGTAISEDLCSISLYVQLNMLGRAKKVMIDKEHDDDVTAPDKKADIEARVAQIKAQIEETTSDYDKEKLQERRAVGRCLARHPRRRRDSSPVKERRTAWTMRRTRHPRGRGEGVLPGGGVALLRSVKALSRVKPEKSLPAHGCRDVP